MTVSEPKTGNKFCPCQCSNHGQAEINRRCCWRVFDFFWALILTDGAMAESQTEFATVTTKNPLSLIIGRVLRRWRMEIKIAEKLQIVQ